MILELIRINQWYKNLVIFVAIIFSLNLFSVDKLIMNIIAFFSLGILSSSNYILNDIVDREKDKNHSDKKYRPIASGKISVLNAFIISVVLSVAGLVIAFSINFEHFLLSVVFLLTGIFYTFFLKNIFLADAITIAINFIIRAVLGAVAIGVSFSVWLIICTFLLALTLVFGKRKIEILRSNENHKLVLKNYNENILNNLSLISVSALLISYSIYIVNNSILVITLPIATFLLFRYISFLSSNDKIIETPEKLFTDKQIILGLFLWIVIVLLILYFVIK